MRRKLRVVLAIAGCVTATALMLMALRTPSNAAFAQSVPGKAAIRPASPQPDTSSPNWKELSNDVGVMIREDDRLGLRGRLYVRVNGLWFPVATDGPAETGTIPVR